MTARERARGDRGERREQVALEAGKNRLGLGIAEAAVELQHSGPVLGEHEAGVEEALEGSPPGGQLAEHWQVDSLHESLRLLLEPGDG